jgi:OOP family OmpA-OmpF porin
LRQLNRVVDAMRKCASLELQVAGHTDADGGDGYNTMLSEKRAKSVLKYIKGQGISDTRLKYNGYGEKYPIAPNSTEEGKQKNRRAEIHVSRAQ